MDLTDVLYCNRPLLQLKRLFLAAVMVAVAVAAALAAAAMEYLNQFPTTPLPDCHSHPPTIPLPLVMNLSQLAELNSYYDGLFYAFFSGFQGISICIKSLLIVKNGKADFHRMIFFFTIKTKGTAEPIEKKITNRFRNIIERSNISTGFFSNFFKLWGNNISKF